VYAYAHVTTEKYIINHNIKESNKPLKMWQSVSGTTITDVTCIHEEMKSKLNPETRKICPPVALTIGRLKHIKLLFCLLFMWL
jgi:hypothetical protein